MSDCKTVKEKSLEYLEAMAPEALQAIHELASSDPEEVAPSVILRAAIYIADRGARVPAVRSVTDTEKEEEVPDLAAKADLEGSALAELEKRLQA